MTASTFKVNQKQNVYPGDLSKIGCVHPLVWKHMEGLGLNDTPTAAEHFGQTVEDFEKGFDVHNVIAFAKQNALDELKIAAIQELNMTEGDADKLTDSANFLHAVELEVEFLDRNARDFPFEAIDIGELQVYLGLLRGLTGFIKAKNAGARERARHYFGSCYCEVADLEA